MKILEIVHQTDIRKAENLLEAITPDVDSRSSIWTSVSLFDFWLGRKSRVIESIGGQEFVTKVESGMLPAAQKRLKRYRLPKMKVSRPPIHLALKIAEETGSSVFTRGFLIRVLQQTEALNQDEMLINLLKREPRFWLEHLKFIEKLLADSADEEAMEAVLTSLIQKDAWTESTETEDGERERLVKNSSALATFLRRLENFRKSFEVELGLIPSPVGEKAERIEPQPQSENFFHRLGINRMKPIPTTELDAAYYQAKADFMGKAEDLDKIEEAYVHLSDVAQQYLYLLDYHKRRRELNAKEQKALTSVTQRSIESKEALTPVITQQSLMKKSVIASVVGAGAVSGVLFAKMTGFTAVHAVGAFALGTGIAFLQTVSTLQMAVIKRRELDQWDRDKLVSEGLVFGAALSGCAGLLHYLSQHHH